MASGLRYFLSDKPKVPKYPTVDIAKTQAEALAANQINLPALEALGTAYDTYSQTETDKALEAALPGYKQLVTGNIQSMLKGEVPQDVKDLLTRTAAQRGVAFGRTGEQQKFDELRTLGLTSLDQIGRGLDAASRWIQQARAPVADISNMFISPQANIALKERENLAKFQRDWLANKISAIPWGAKGWAINFADRIEEMGNSIVSMYAGGALGGASKGGGGEGAGTGGGQGSSGGWSFGRA